MEHYKNLNIEDTDGEEWLDCIGYDGLYSVSNYGRVRSEQREVKCGRGWKIKPAFIMKQQITKSNYNNLKESSKSLKVSFCIDYKRKTFNVSELVGQTFLGGKKKNEVYSKKNKQWFDCTLENLEIKTFSQCFSLAYEKGNNLRKKKHMNYNHTPVNIFKRLSDGKEFTGGNALKEEYGYDCQKGIKNSLKTGNLCKNSHWQIIPISYNGEELKVF